MELKLLNTTLTLPSLITKTSVLCLVCYLVTWFFQREKGLVKRDVFVLKALISVAFLCLLVSKVAAFGKTYVIIIWRANYPHGSIDGS